MTVQFLSFAISFSKTKLEMKGMWRINKNGFKRERQLDTGRWTPEPTKRIGL